MARQTKPSGKRTAKKRGQHAGTAAAAPQRTAQKRRTRGVSDAAGKTAGRRPPAKSRAAGHNESRAKRTHQPKSGSVISSYTQRTRAAIDAALNGVATILARSRLLLSQFKNASLHLMPPSPKKLFRIGAG